MFLKTHRNTAIIKHIFLGFIQNKLGHLRKKDKIKQEFLAATSSIKALEAIAATITIALKSGEKQSLRINLKPSKSISKLIFNISHYVPLDEKNPLSKGIKLETATFSKNNVRKLVKNREKTTKAISIPIADLSAFVVQQLETNKNKKTKIPALVNAEIKVYIVGTSKNGQPTSIIFWIDGKPKIVKNKRQLARKLKTTILKPGLV